MSANSKSLIYLVDPDSKHRKQISVILRPYYEIKEFSDGHDAIKAMRQKAPAVIINCEDNGSRPVGQFVARVEDMPHLQNVPLIYILDVSRKYSIREYKDLGVKYHVYKPVVGPQLLQIVSKLLNQSVEEEWKSLPETQRLALENSLGVFNSIADSIGKGEAVSFSSVKNNCQSLVESIEKNDFLPILDGVRSHDDYTYAHSMRVATLLTLLGHAAGFKNDDQLLMSSGGLLHDVGKMEIPHEILNKPGRLTDEEFEIMKGHVKGSVDYLKKLDNIPKGVFIIAEQHHEKIDGTGYPHGLKGKELNELARMAAIVDVFSALTDRRVYKDPMEASKAMSIMTEEMTGHLDQHYVKLFRTILIDSKVLI